MVDHSWVSNAPKTVGSGMFFAFALSLPACCSYLSLKSGMVESGVAKFLTACKVICLPHLKHSFLLGTFTCKLSQRQLPP